jgi:FkbM family methyltransferase
MERNPGQRQRIVSFGAHNDLLATVPPGDYCHYLPDNDMFDYWCIDALWWCCRNIRDAAKQYGVAGRYHVLHHAVSDFDGPATFIVNHCVDMCSSLRKQVGDPWHDELPVEVRRVDTLMDEGLLPQGADYCQIDVQGSELEVLKGGPRFFSQVMMAWVEVEFQPLYVGQALYPEVRAEMERLGFEQVTDVDLDPSGREWDDALYVRRELLDA